MDKESIVPAMNPEEEKIFCNMQRELKEMRDEYGSKAAFWLVEMDYDDECLDIYRD